MQNCEANCTRHDETEVVRSTIDQPVPIKIRSAVYHKIPINNNQRNYERESFKVLILDAAQLEMTSNTATVVLLIPDDLQTYALAVSDILSSCFDIVSVTIRSSNAPADRLLQTYRENHPTLFVVIGASTSSSSVLEAESPAPIITLPTNNAPLTALAIAKCCTLASDEIRQRVQAVVVANRQARLVQDSQLRTTSLLYSNAIAKCYDRGMQVTGDKFGVAAEHRGKVRDRFPAGVNQVALATTDRQSGFDRMLAQVPYKGAVLNLTSAFWFEQTRTIIPNHLISVPHPYISICRRCIPFPIEFVVR